MQLACEMVVGDCLCVWCPLENSWACASELEAQFWSIWNLKGGQPLPFGKGGYRMVNRGVLRRQPCRENVLPLES